MRMLKMEQVIEKALKLKNWAVVGQPQTKKNMVI